RFPASSPLPSRLYLLCRFSQKLHSTSPFAHLCRAPPVGSVRSPLPFAALPSISLFPSARFADDTDETNDEARQIVLLLVVVLVIERTRLIEEEDDDEDEDFRTSQRLTVLERGLLTAARFPLGP